MSIAVKYGVPFVPKSGGHSAWSTIGSDGIIVDLSNYNKVIVDKSLKTVRVQAGVLNKELIGALYEEGLCVRKLLLFPECSTRGLNCKFDAYQPWEEATQSASYLKP